MSPPSRLGAMLDALEAWATAERAADALRRLAETPAPSQTAAWTRGPVVGEHLAAWNVLDRDHATWDANFEGTGNGVLQMGRGRRKRVWMVAHWDTISFLVGPETREGFSLVPFFLHVMESGSHRGCALEYDEATGAYEVMARGSIVGAREPWFVPDGDARLRPGMRVVFDSPPECLGGHVWSGELDNAAGCAAVLLAGAFLSAFDDLDVMICLSDEEEGPVAVGNTAFSRGSRRILDHFEAPDLAIIADIHSLPEHGPGPRLGDGALVREYASRARGGVTPPWLYGRVTRLASELRPHVLLHENRYGDLGRSDCISVMHKTPNVVLCGVAASGRHFLHGVADRCSAFDVAHLARSLVAICVDAHSTPGAAPGATRLG
jgi:putative aminopeptidase FrvX